MDDFIKPKSLVGQGEETAKKSTDAVQDGNHTARRSADETVGKMVVEAQGLQSNAAPLLEKATDQARKLLEQSREALQDTTQRVRDKATDISDMATSYTEEEPMKAILISAAAGAFLMSLVMMVTRSSR